MNFSSACCPSELGCVEANKGNLEEQYNLALLYETGYYGVKEDRAEAFKWYKKACDGGLKKACEDLKSF